MILNFPIGVFDSGVGGLSILQSLQRQLPHENFVYFADSLHAPYGEKPPEFIHQRCVSIVRQLVMEHHIKALVIACNTATAVSASRLRVLFPSLPIVGVEPAIKPAVTTSKTGVIAVMATQGTLHSDKFQSLCRSLAFGANETNKKHLILQPCSGLAHSIEEQNQPAIEHLCLQHTQEIVKKSQSLGLSGFGTEKNQIDTIVLGCTHYPFVKNVLKECVGDDVSFLDNSHAVAQQTHKMLQKYLLLCSQKTIIRTNTNTNENTIFLSSGDAQALQSVRWLASRLLSLPVD